jgi:hypothetical protein
LILQGQDNCSRDGFLEQPEPQQQTEQDGHFDGGRGEGMLLEGKNKTQDFFKKERGPNKYSKQKRKDVSLMIAIRKEEEEEGKEEKRGLSLYDSCLDSSNSGKVAPSRFQVVCKV